MKLQLITLPIALLNSLNGCIKNNEQPQKTEYKEIRKADNETLTSKTITLGQFLTDYDATPQEEGAQRIDSYSETKTIATDELTITYTYVNQLYGYYYSGEDGYDLYRNQYLYIYMEITPYITFNIKQFTIQDYSQNEILWYINVPKEIPNYKIPNSVKNYNPYSVQKYDDTPTMLYQLPQGKTTNILLLIKGTNTQDVEIYDESPYQRTLTYRYTQTNLEVNYDIIDLPALLWEIVAMPFSFITLGFDLTLFPGTPYAINIANTIMVFVGILILFAILKIVLKIFL